MNPRSCVKELEEPSPWATPWMRQLVLVGALMLQLVGTAFGQAEIVPATSADQESSATKEDSPPPTEKHSVKTTLKLTVDFSDGYEVSYDLIEWRRGMTVLDVMRDLSRHAHPLTFEFRGKGETAFLTSIQGVKNQGGEGGNWIFRVNGKLAKQGCGVTALEKGDTILWRFTGGNYNSSEESNANEGAK